MADQYPEHLFYTKDHEWTMLEGNTATVGITHHAQGALGEIVFLELPAVGKVLNKGDTFGVVESIKAVSDLYSPLSGKIVAINSDLVNDPGSINTDSYKNGWMIKIEVQNPEEMKELLAVGDYKKLVDSL